MPLSLGNTQPPPWGSQQWTRVGFLIYKTWVRQGHLCENGEVMPGGSRRPSLLSTEAKGA